jgi:hypothetical protein
MVQYLMEYEAADSVDFDRLERSLLLQAEKTGYGQYRVAGGAQEHWVDLYTASHPKCDCGDYLWRDRICKHILAALLREGNERVLQAVGALFVALKTT